MYDDQEWEPPTEADLKLMAARRERADAISKLMAGYLLKGYKMLGSVCEKCDTILLQDRQGTNYCVACSELDSDTDKDNPAINESAAISMARELELASAAGSSSPSVTNVASGASPSVQNSAVTSAGIQCLSNQSLTSASENLFPTKQERSESKPKAINENPASVLSISSIDVQSFTANTVGNSRDQKESKELSSISKSGTEGAEDSGFFSSRLVNKKQTRTRTECSSDIFSVHVSRIQEKICWASKELENTPSLEYSIQLCNLIKTASEAIVALRNARI